jgi:hypothetical protein
VGVHCNQAAELGSDLDPVIKALGPVRFGEDEFRSEIKQRADLIKHNKMVWKVVWSPPQASYTPGIICKMGILMQGLQLTAATRMQHGAEKDRQDEMCP